MCLACDRDQAKIVLNYIRSFFTDIPALKAMVQRETQYGFELGNSIDITVATNSFRAVRGKPILLAIIDEAAFMSSDTSANPDTELYAALRPGMLTIPGSRMVIISSPHRKAGLLWERYRKYFGKNDPNTLVIQASVRQLNPTITQAQIDIETAEDPAKAVSELQGQFRDDVGAFLPLELIESAVDKGVMVRPYREGFTYHCGVDPSGGVADSFCAAISHREADGKVVLDAAIELKAPLDPDVAVTRVVELMKEYKLTKCTGDRYSAGFAVSSFARHGVRYVHSERDRSAIYADVLSCFTSGRARLLDTPKSRLVVQFAGLQRTTSSMGRDKIDHSPGQKDDLANAVSLSLVLADAKVHKPMFFAVPYAASRSRSFDGGVGELHIIGGDTPVQQPPPARQPITKPGEAPEAEHKRLVHLWHHPDERAAVGLDGNAGEQRLIARISALDRELGLPPTPLPDPGASQGPVRFHDPMCSSSTMPPGGWPAGSSR
jgi:hypothetical protein